MYAVVKKKKKEICAWFYMCGGVSTPIYLPKKENKSYVIYFFSSGLICKHEVLWSEK